MFWVKAAIIGLVGFSILFFTSKISGQESIEEFNIAIEKAYSYQNINSDSILRSAGIAYNIATHMQNPNLQIDALTLIIETLSKSGKYSAAIVNCLKADSISTINNLMDRKTEMLMYKGLVYQSSGFIPEGLDLLFLVQDQIDKNGLKDIEADLNYYIALAYFDLGETDKSTDYAMKSVEIDIKKKNISGLVKNYILLANGFNNLDSIHKYLSMAETVIDKYEMDYKKAALLNSKALLFKALSDLNHAKSCYNEAIIISTENGYTSHLANLYNNYAYLLMEEQKLDSAQLILAKALRLARELENIDIEASILDSYSDYYTNIGDSSKSFKYYKSSIKLRNEYREKQRIERSLFLSTVFETEKKEKEIARQDSKLYRINAILLAVFFLFATAIAILFYFRQKSATREAQLITMEHGKKLEIANALIEGQDVERKRLAMDLHDGISPRVGSLKLAVEKSFGGSDNVLPIVESIIELNHNIRDLSHKMLPSQLESHGLVQAIKNLVALSERSSDIIFSFYSNINNRFNPKLEINLYYLSYEMINNAIKHAVCKYLSIQLLEDEQSISLSVEDDGKGFNPDIDFEGLGLKNIRQRVSYLDGKLTIDTGIGQGTAIIIEIEKWHT